MIKLPFPKCEIQISYLFVVALTCAALLDTTGYAAWGAIAAVLHECGHIAMMALKKSPPGKIVFGVFNVDIMDYSRVSRNYRDDIQILAAGCAVNICVGALIYLLFMATNSQSLLVPAFANLFVGLFNLLPVEPLDGGQIVYTLVSAGYGTEKAQTVVSILSFFILVPIATVGFLVLLQSKYNFSLLFISCYLMAILLLKKGRYY